MHHKNYLLIVFSFCSFGLQAQSEKYEILFLENKFDEIIQLADSNITTGSKLSQDYFWKANALNNIGKYSQAISNLETAVELSPTDIVLKEFLVNLYFDNGMYFNAMPIIDTLLLKDSTNFNLLSKKILLCEFNNKYNKSITILKKHILRDTTNAFFLLHLADNYYKINNIDSAIFYYDKVYKQNPNNIKTAYKIAKIYLKVNTKKALPICDSILKKDNSNIPFIKIKAYSLKKLGKNREALNFFNSLASLGDSSFSTIKYIGILRYKTDDFHFAKTTMEKAMKIDNSDVDLNYFYGCALALDTVHYKMINTDSTNSVIRYKLSSDSIYKVKQEACNYIHKSIDLLSPTKTLSIMYSKLGEINRELKKYKKALYYHKLAYKNNPENLDQIFFIACVYEIINDKKTALKKYQEFATKVNDNQYNSYYIELANIKIKYLKEDLFFSGDLK
ncbi:MAG: hypothetical protein DRJ01_03055 [Bacteroidetes bacterium]|nr:MAG: hypothetical protein DRJ01_03055 [Bacteroidota bacterium]